MKQQLYTIASLILFLTIFVVMQITGGRRDSVALLSSVLSSIHSIALVAGIGGVFIRGIFLRRDLSEENNVRGLFA